MSAVHWHIDSCSCIGGHDVSVVGSPRLVEIYGERAVEFSGDGDGLLIPVNPAQGLTAFTAEVVLMPYSDGPMEQRFFHMQEFAESGNRILLETRNNGWRDPMGAAGGMSTESVPADSWFLDACLASGGTRAAIQFNTSCPHKVDAWYTVSVVVDGSSFATFVNGVREEAPERSHSGRNLATAWVPHGEGVTTLGMRTNFDALTRSKHRDILTICTESVALSFGQTLHLAIYYLTTIGVAQWLHVAVHKSNTPYSLTAEEARAVSFFKGAVREIRITPKALSSKEFLSAQTCRDASARL